MTPETVQTHAVCMMVLGEIRKALDEGDVELARRTVASVLDETYDAWEAAGIIAVDSGATPR